jgi:hypothetical protein
MHGGLWLNTSGADITRVDRLQEGIQRKGRNAESTPGFDGTQATVIDPIVDNLARDLQARGNLVGGKVISSNILSLQLSYNEYILIIRVGRALSRFDYK